MARNWSCSWTSKNKKKNFLYFLFFLFQPPGIGLGFSIAGGIDTPCISDSPAVVITRITEGGLADRDQRLK